MKIWAIGDLHLGFSTGKWMEVFGDHWQDHHRKVEDAWHDLVDSQDIVLVPGDTSWAMKSSDARQDLEWLAALPGSKLLIKGNHDYWWPGSRKKLAELLPPGIHAIKKKALVLDGIPFIGVRGCDFTVRDGEDPREVDKRLRRERTELLQSIEDLARIYDGERRPICLFHYPPFPVGGRDSAFTRVLEDAGCTHCVYGHLHTEAEHERVFQGLHRGVRYLLTSCDYLRFRPCLVETVP